MAAEGLEKTSNQLVDDVGIAAASAQRGVAAILFTYRCTIACQHCLFGCASERPNVVMSAGQCVDYLRLLHETGRIVHIAGGEAMLYWDTLQDALRLAHTQGCAPHFIETNCSFATHDAVVSQRLAFFKSVGVRGLFASADPLHQHHVPAENFLRVRRAAHDLFGPRNFWGPAATDDQVRDFEAIGRDPDRLGQWVRQHPPVMVGAAQKHLAQYLPQLAPDDAALPGGSWRGPADPACCRYQFEPATLWELHIDPYGNIQTNCGIILGHVPETTPAEVLGRGPDRANRFAEIVSKGGARALADFASREHGFQVPRAVAQTCHLCYLARRHLRQFYPDIFGPTEAYTA